MNNYLPYTLIDLMLSPKLTCVLEILTFISYDELGFAVLYLFSNKSYSKSVLSVILEYTFLASIPLELCKTKIAISLYSLGMLIVGLDAFIVPISVQFNFSTKQIIIYTLHF